MPTGKKRAAACKIPAGPRTAACGLCPPRPPLRVSWTRQVEWCFASSSRTGQMCKGCLLYKKSKSRTGKIIWGKGTCLACEHHKVVPSTAGCGPNCLIIFLVLSLFLCVWGEGGWLSHQVPQPWSHTSCHGPSSAESFLT